MPDVPSQASVALRRGDRVTRAGLVVAGVVCVSVIVSHIFGRSTYSVLLPAISDDLVSSYSAAGFLGASYFTGYLLGVIAVTLVSSRIEPITLMRTGLGLSVLALAVMATAPRFSVFSSGAFFVGLAGAGIWIPAPTVATSRIPAKHRGLVMGALTAAMGLGLLGLSQGVNAYRDLIGDDSSWRAIFGIEAGVTVLIAGLAFVAIRTPGRGSILPAGQAQPVGRTGPAPTFSFDPLKAIPNWGLLTVSYTLFALLAGSWTQFLGVAAHDDAGFSATHVTNLYSVLAIAGVPGPLLLGRLSDRVGRDRAMAVAAGLACVASLLLPIGREPFVSIAVALYGAGSFGFPPLAAAAVRDHVEGGRFGTAFGTMTVMYAIFSIIASQLAGILADATGSFVLVYLFLAGAALLSVGAALVRYGAPDSLVAH